MFFLRPIARSPFGLLLLVAVAAVVLQGGSVPHTHGGIGPGFYNQDHDGALLATLHGVATITAIPAAVQPGVVLASIAPLARAHVDSTPWSSAPSRAPPHA
jgi:hypothetical protein